MSVRVMFADSSRAAAHNLNDLYERWQLRREQEQVYYPDKKLAEVEFKDYTNPKDLDEAYLMRDELIEIINELQKRLKDKRHFNEFGETVPLALHQVYRNTLTDQLNYMTKCKKINKEIIAEWHREKYSRDKEIAMMTARLLADEEGDIWFITQAFNLIKNLRKQHQLVFTPEQDSLMDKLKARMLMEDE